MPGGNKRVTHKYMQLFCYHQALNGSSYCSSTFTYPLPTFFVLIAQNHCFKGFKQSATEAQLELCHTSLMELFHKND